MRDLFDSVLDNFSTSICPGTEATVAASSLFTQKHIRMRD